LTKTQEAAAFEAFAQKQSGSKSKILEKYIAERTARTGKRGRPVTREAVVSRLKAAGYPV
jgi:hypothetical protein